MREYDDISLEKNTSDQNTLFLACGLMPMLYECIEDIKENSDAFANKIAKKMIIRIFKDIKKEISHEYSGSDKTIRAAKNLLQIALEDKYLKRELEEVLTFLSEYGYRPFSEGVSE